MQVSEDGKQKVQMESQFYPTPNEIIRGNGSEVRGQGLCKVGGRPGHLVYEWPCLSPVSCAFSSLQLFEYVADCVADFMKTRGLKNKKFPLGLTFSFPCRQTKLEEVRLGREEAVQDLEFGAEECLGVRLGTGGVSRSFLACIFFFFFLTDEVEMRGIELIKVAAWILGTAQGSGMVLPS